MRAGTGTGKTLAYLVPAMLSGQRVVVATATKALQDQLAGKDLPFLAEHLDVAVRLAPCSRAGRTTCAGSGSTKPRPRATGRPRSTSTTCGPSSRVEVRRLAAWAATSPTGDQAELDWPPSPASGRR